jgi:hypothetical protein
MNTDKKLNQTLVYWAPSGMSGFGNTGYVAGVEHACRWQDGPVIFKDANGDDAQARSTVYVDGSSGMVEDGKAFLGELTDLTAGEIADPTLTDLARPIVAIAPESPNLRNTQSLLKLGVN